MSDASSNEPHNAVATTDSSTRTTRFVRLLDRLVDNTLSRYEHAQVFPFPFLVTEEDMRQIAAESQAALASVPIDETIDFQGSSRFADLSSQRYENFELFLARAGKRQDPESATISWSRFAISNTGEPVAGKIHIEFMTEKRLVSTPNNPDSLPIATITLTVSGSDQRWVDQTFEDIKPHVATLKLAGVLRPLWIFRNVWVVNITSMVLSWMAFILGNNFASKALSKPFELERDAALRSMLVADTAEAKLDAYFQWIMTPSNSPWYRGVLIFGFGAICFAIVYFSARLLLPRLTPNAAIAIGVAHRRALTALDGFKFVVFTVIMSGFILPVLVELIKWML